MSDVIEDVTPSGSTSTKTDDLSSAYAASVRAQRREKVLVFFLRLGVFVIFAALWQFFGARAGNPTIATFTQTLSGLATLLTSSSFWSAFFNSNQAMALGYLASVLIAIPLGLAAGRSQAIDRLTSPYVAILLAMPVAPLIPVVVVALGLGLSSRVLIVFLFSFIFITVNTRAGVKQVDKSIIEMAHSYGASESEVWRMVIVPAASPAIFSGLRIGLGRAVTGMVIVELLLVATGLGRLLLQFSGRLQGDLMFGVIVAVVLEMLILLRIMLLIEKRATSWSADVSG